jgi:phosphomannomutase
MIVLKTRRVTNIFCRSNTEWLLIRASGTEPVLRTYTESTSRENAFAILKAAEETLLS